MGTALARLAAKYNMTAAELAREMGISKMHAGRLMRGESAPGMELAHKLQNYFGRAHLTVEDLKKVAPRRDAVS